MSARMEESRGTGYLLWRWSVKVMAVQRDRGMAEQKDTLQARAVSWASWV